LLANYRLLALLIDVSFLALQGMILAHVVLGWTRVAANRIAWLRHPVALWLDNAGGRILRPFRRFLQAVGLRRLTRPLDFSPAIAMTLLQWLHALARWALTGH
jgi:hypothetical protein